MSSRKLAGDSTRYDRLDGQARVHDGDTYPLQNTFPSTEAFDTSVSTFLSPARSRSSSRSIVKRRRPNTRPLAVRLMSLVGLKNFFFRQTVTPVPVRYKSKSDFDMTSASPCIPTAAPERNNDSRQPLLRSNGLSTPSNFDRDLTRSNLFDSADVESQSVNSKTEKANQKKGFRIDARIISDATIGLSDGLTVPFALTAGLSALGDTRVVIYGGFAELIAGAISMGLGGYLGAKSEA